MEPNPYRPPSSIDEGLSLLNVLRYLLATKRQRNRSKFARGYAILFEGISFFVAPENASVLYAASPSSETSDTRMNLVVAEVVRLAPQFVGKHDYLSSLLAGRTTVVRLVENYADKQTQYIREELLDLQLLG